VIPYRLIGYLAGAIAVLGALFWVTHAVYEAGDRNGAARVQKDWDDDKAAIVKVTAQAIADATKQRDDALNANEAIQNDYQTELLTARATAIQFAQRLRDYQTRAATDRGPVPKAGDHQNSSATSAESAAEAGIYERLANYDQSCQADAAQLNALIREIRPQL
jgi:hypothetical protein